MKIALQKPVRMSVASMPGYLPIVRSAVEKICQLIGFDEETVGRIILSVDEAMTNIIRHSYHGADDRQIDVELSPQANPRAGLRITLRDYGDVFDPQTIKPSCPDNKYEPGGLGVHIMNMCMDNLEYKPAKDGGMELVMLKYLHSGRKK